LTEYRRPQVLDASSHRREDFDSGEPALDDWLRRYSGQNRRGNTAATWVIVDRDDVVVAYASLSMSSVDASAAPADLARGAPRHVPALLLGRLAVDHRHAGVGLGTALVAHVLEAARELNLSAACKAVVVTALHAQARAWWERVGFSPLDPGDPDGLDLYLLTSDIEATLSGLS
jgi:predicted N-acetyltransferase YhbS